MTKFLNIDDNFINTSLDLLKQGKEIGGTIIKDDNDNLSFFTCTKGKETSVEYDRLNYTYSYHTHPLVAFPELPHLPPSPFDIVGGCLG